MVAEQRQGSPSVRQSVESTGPRMGKLLVKKHLQLVFCGILVEFLFSTGWSIGGHCWSIGGSLWNIGGIIWTIGEISWSIGWDSRILVKLAGILEDETIIGTRWSIGGFI